MLRTEEKRYNILFSMVFFVMFAVYGTVMPAFGIRTQFYENAKIVPDIMLAGVISCSLLYNKRAAAIFGLVCGFACDIFVNSPFMFCTVLYFLAGYFSAEIELNFNRKTVFAMLLVSLPVFFVRQLIIALNIMLQFSIGSVGKAVMYFLTELLVNIAGACIVYIIIRAILRFGEKKLKL